MAGYNVATLSKLIEQFERMPGIGRKTAQRLAFYVLNLSKEQATEFSETILSAHEKIKDVAVIGLPDVRLGEIAVAVIEAKEGVTLTEDEVNEFCAGLPRYKRPRKIIFAKVPRNPTGKIEKPKLRQLYGGERLVAAQNNG